MESRRSPEFFFAAFRHIARGYTYFRRDLLEIARKDPLNDECPSGCEKAKGGDGFCQDCAVGRAWRDYRETVEAQLEKHGLKAFSFESLHRDLIRVRQIEGTVAEGELSGEWTTTIEQLVQMIRYETRRAELIDEWNERQSRKEG